MWQTTFKQCLYTSPSGYKVYQNLLYRWLTLDSEALQTLICRMNIGSPILYYLPAMTLMARHIPGEVCLLGLGGGGVAHYLNKQQAYSSITAIDCSEEIIDIAKRFFKIGSLPQLSIIHQNANDYMQECDKSYSHILVDIYNAHHFPKECANEYFFLQCKRNLKPGGYLAINLANVNEQKFILQLVKGLFKNTVIFPIPNCGNMVIFACDLEDKNLFLQQLEQTNEVKKMHWVEFWGYAGIVD